MTNIITMDNLIDPVCNTFDFSKHALYQNEILLDAWTKDSFLMQQCTHKHNL